MRKFLSLVLALVMMMSLVTINAGAKEFSDDGDITYKEAVDVISAIHVVDGYSNGNFNPGGNLTRGAAAKIICNMVLGPTTASELHADTAPFRDVPAGHDFAGYIAYCQKEGIISGYSDGTFRPAGTLTGYAFLKMLLGALGYDAEIEKYVGPNWTINVAKQAIGIGLNKSLEGTFDGGKYITREEAALYAFNTLRSDLVEYDTKITTTINGAEVTVGNSLAKAQTWNNSLTRHDNIRNDEYIQFAEQYFNKLVLTESEDCFGRPDREWKFDGDEIGAYINYDLFKQEYTAKVTGKELRDLLGGTVVDDYTFDITIDGEQESGVLGGAYFTQGNLVRTNTEKVGSTGNGVLTQVFVDNDKTVQHVWIAIINTYLAKANADYNAKKDEVTYSVWQLDNAKGYKDHLVKTDDKKINLTVDGEDFEIEDVKDGDITLVHVADGEIKEFVDPETVDNTELTAFKKGDWIKADSEQYDYADTIMYDDEVLDNYDDTNMKDTTYRVFIDEYGYAIGIEIIDAVDQYAFLTGIDGNGSHLTNKYADGKLIFTDGTVETARINIEDSKALNPNFVNDSGKDPYVRFSEAALWNTWCTYTVDSNGVYTLTEVANNKLHFENNDSGVKYDGTKRSNDKLGQGRDYDTSSDGANKASATAGFTRTMDKKRVGLNGISGTGYSNVYGNDDTIYLTAETEFINDAVNGKPDASRLNSDAKTTGNIGSRENIIIDGVDSVSTGIQNISLDVYNINQVMKENGITTLNSGKAGTDDNVANGVYTLFKDNGYVIAAVVVGEDNGSTSKYAYVTSESGKDGLSQEEWTKADGKWKWTREAIVDGVLVDLVEVGDSLSSDGIKGMARNNWYEVKYKADGTVRKVQLISQERYLANTDPHLNGHGTDKDYVFCTEASIKHSDNVTAHSNYPKYAGRIDYVDSVNNNKNSLTENDGTVVLFENMTKGTGKNYKIDAKGNTLMVETGGTLAQGFAVSANAKIALVQDVKPTNGDLKEMDYIETYESGQTALKQAIDYLNDNDDDGYFDGYLSAVFENGLATSVVIYDVDPTSVDQGNTGGTTSETYATYRANNRDLGTVTVRIDTRENTGINAVDARDVDVSVNRYGELTVALPVGKNPNSIADLTIYVNGANRSSRMNAGYYSNSQLIFDSANLDLYDGDVVDVIVRNVVKVGDDVVDTNGTKITAGVASVPAGTATTQTGVKALTAGAYQFSAGTTFTDDLASNVHGKPQENIFFVYETNDTTPAVATLTITSAEGKTMYAETFTPGVGTDSVKHLFWVQVVSADGSALANAAPNYPMTTQSLPKGAYTWTITGANVKGTAAGAFSIG